MNRNTMIANGVTVGGIGLCLAIAQLPLVATISILGATVVGCVYLTKKDKQKNTPGNNILGVL